MKTIKLMVIATMLLSFGMANAQKVTNVESGGRLKICTLSGSNYSENCKTVESSGVALASIGATKVAILYKTGKLKVCSVSNSNYTEKCTTAESSGVSNVQMSGDSRIIITYDDGKKKACSISSNNYKESCKTIWINYHQWCRKPALLMINLRIPLFLW